jgi:hypothetical protein
MPLKPAAGPDQPAPEDDYYAMQSDMAGGMLLAPLRYAPNDARWTVGQRFVQAPAEPVVAKIRNGYEDAEPRPFLGVPPIVSDKLLAVLRAAGVSNLDVYDAVLQSADGSVALKGYKAFNLIGLVAAADLAQTRFAPDNASRFLDASIDGLVIDPAKAGGQLMFRLAENTSAILVHRSVKAAIESAGIAHIEFLKPSEFLS